MNAPTNRRRFILTTGAAATAGQAQAAPAFSVSIASSPSDPIASAPPAQWAAKELESALGARGVSVHRCETPAQARQGDLCIVARGTGAPEFPEGLAIVAEGKTIAAAGHDTRGLVYALLELADRVQNHADPAAALAISKPIAEHPANQVRAVTRMFTSDVEDKPWFNDREMWPRYLTMLASQRFNRFHLALGIGYDFIRQVSDSYFVFSYPYLIDVPGYNVRVPQLPDAERDRNLEMLRFISEQTAARGMQFQLGLWMHGYEWIDSPNPNYTIAGITKHNHGPYCRDAVRMLLKACPAISGVTFRVHGESGVEEGSYDFWRMVFEGVATCGRKVEIDMHSKGMDQTMLDMAVATRLPVRLSPKFWAEHMGMPYHQADIRELEKPKQDSTGLMKFSTGSRNFLRYGYGDLLREDRQWSVIHRIWPGTQRLLLWGDPQSAAGYSRAFRFCGSDGVDICEPLSFKGRRGSGGPPGNRCAYADASLRPRWDWEKYEYGHRVWGRLLYNPEAAPDTWGRYLNRRFGPAAADLEAALSSASRILPTVTTAHSPSAANNSYWPEVYFNQSMVDAAHPAPYTDSPAPRVFGNATPLDPQLFSRIDDFADQLLSGEGSGKYTPVEVAQWLEDCAAGAMAGLARAEARATGKSGAEYRRFTIDVALQADMGRMFAAKFRSGVLYRIYEKTGDRAALEESIAQYRKARAALADAGDRAKGVYLPDITVGEHPQLRGHWLDRLPAVDADIALVAAKIADAQPSADPRVAAAIKEALASPRRGTVVAGHRPPAKFQAGQALALEIAPAKGAASVRLCYRHVDQAENYASLEMRGTDGVFRGAIPAEYTSTRYPLEYYFEIKEAGGQSNLYPGFSRERANQPYFVVRSV